MKFVITKPLKVNSLPRTFELEVTVMFGDADGYKTFPVQSFIPGLDDDALEDLIGVLNALKAKYPNGRSSRDHYRDVAGFQSWFGENEIETAEDYVKYSRSTVPYADFLKHYEFATRVANRTIPLNGEYPEYPEWPSEPYGDGSEASFDGFKIFYYDENLVKHDVKVM